MLFLVSVLFQSVVPSPRHAFLPLVPLIPADEFYLFFKIQLKESLLLSCLEDLMLICHSVFCTHSPLTPQSPGHRRYSKACPEASLTCCLSPTIKYTPSLFQPNSPLPVEDSSGLDNPLRKKPHNFCLCHVLWDTSSLSHAVTPTSDAVTQYSLSAFSMSCQVDSLGDTFQ